MTPENTSSKHWITHKYDYDNAKMTAGTAFNSSLGREDAKNLVEYNQHFMGRPGRRKMVDKFVRYHYPTCVHTTYHQQHQAHNSSKAVGRKNTGEAFNVEKEHKIINPHHVEGNTQSMITYKPFDVQPKEKRQPDVPKDMPPYPWRTTNQQNLVDWGPNEIIHERSPQYPYYALPFKGDSQNARTYQTHSAEKIKTSNGHGFTTPSA